jgi:tRNA dimethylallyltransferase
MVRGIVIGGPTGVGKTDLAALLAQRLNGELISCDSVQIYTGLTIGANKTPTPVPQHLIDLKHWSCAFTAADFLQSCWKAVKEVVGRGRVPILVGGTGFYLDWVVRGRPGAPPTDPLVLKEVEEMLAKDANWEESLKRLMEVDEEYAAVLMRNDYYRLKRALVVQKMTGAPLSSFKHRRRSSEELSVDWRCFYLAVSNRMALLAHLDKRCEMMVQRGLVQEVLQLVKQGFGPDCQAGRAIGYKEVLDLLAKLRRLPREQWDAAFVEFIGEFQSQTRQYTRRQEKWFYGMQEFQWIERPSLSEDLPDEWGG